MDLVVTHPAALLFTLRLVVLVKAALDRQACPSPILTLMCRLETLPDDVCCDFLTLNHGQIKFTIKFNKIHTDRVARKHQRKLLSGIKD